MRIVFLFLCVFFSFLLLIPSVLGGERYVSDTFGGTVIVEKPPVYHYSEFGGTVTVTSPVYHYVNSSFGGTVTVEESLELSNPSVHPSNGIESYTVFQFNVTWASGSGNSPEAGYLKVNISKSGTPTSFNLSMTYVSGDNETGALYTCSTTLSPTGSYIYRFFGYDGTAYDSINGVGDVVVSSALLSFTYNLSSVSGTFDFKDWTLSLTSVGLTTQYNISEDNQTSEVPAVNITNTGNVPLNITMYWNASPPAGVTVKYNTSFNAPNHGTNSFEVNPSSTLVYSNLAPGSYVNIWIWLDVVNIEAGSDSEIIKITSILYGS